MYRDSYNIKGDYNAPSPDLAPAGKDFPEPGVSGTGVKYSSGKDLMIGSYRGVGRVNDDANKTPNWSDEDVKRTGLTMRQPI